MTPDSNAKTDKKRITLNIEDIDFKVIEALEGVIASSFSSVINQMIREWINQNSDRIMKMWGIDLAGIRRQVQAETKGLSIKKELEELDREIINQLPELFETINSINASKLAELLDINEKTLERVIFGHRKELLKVGLDLSYENGLISKKD
jgi:hypothetical protein